MTITCPNLDKFMDVIADLVRRGIGFNADADALVVTLTGAH